MTLHCEFFEQARLRGDLKLFQEYTYNKMKHVEMNGDSGDIS